MAHTPVIIVHGGAWAIPESLWVRSQEGVLRAANAGFGILETGGSAVDAVVAAVNVLEDDPVFDAGTGSCLTADGTVEMDAVVMDGSNLKTGAVAAIQNVPHPVSVARAVMDTTDHCLLVGSGAGAFAESRGFKRCRSEDLVTPEARAEFEAVKAYKEGISVQFRAAAATSPSSSATSDASTAAAPNLPAVAPTPPPPPHDTVGAVCVDAQGCVAAATSTGGITMKLPGRVGDSPIVGSGCFADNELGGASTTGHGESIIKVLLAYRALSTAESLRTQQPVASSGGNASNGSGKDDSSSTNPEAVACRDELARMLAKVGGVGGVIMVGPTGQPGLGHTSVKMPWAVCQPTSSKTAQLAGEVESAGTSTDGTAECAETSTTATTAMCREKAAAAAAEAASAGRWLRSGMDSDDAPRDLCIPK